MKIHATALTFCLLSSVTAAAGTLTPKIAEDYRIIRTDKFAGHDRTVFTFEGCEAWVVEPSVPSAKNRPWTWTMQWAGAFVPRTPVSKLLSTGWHHVTIMTFEHKMDDKGIEISRRFQRYLVDKLGFAPKARLIGMSWGGFFSVRYANAHPELVKSVYLDAPLLTFGKFGAPSPWKDHPPADGNWSKDPRMPVNMAKSLVEAEIPVLLLYGGHDLVVNPKENSEKFIDGFKANGGNIEVVKRGAYGHHPHGVEVDDWSIARFFLKN